MSSYGNGFAQLASRLSKGTHVFVQGELTTREYDRTIQVPSGKKTVEHVIQQLVVELKADTIRLLDRSSAEPTSESGTTDHAEVPRGAPKTWFWLPMDARYQIVSIVED